MLILLVLLFGLIIGSFLSVCIYRIPRHPSYLADLEDEDPKPSDVQPIQFNFPTRSICPACRAELSWVHNLPVLSWLLLQGRCAFCRAPISVRYPTTELLAVIALLLSLHIHGLTPTGFLIAIFIWSLIVISFIDVDFFIIPNVITIPGTLIGVILGLVNGYTGYFQAPVASDILQSLYGIAAGGGFLLAVSEIYLRVRGREGLGLGDVKLLAMTGAFFGPECALFTIFVGSLIGTIGGVAAMIFSGHRFSQQLPFGPYLAAGTVIYLLGGPELVQIIQVTGY